MALIGYGIVKGVSIHGSLSYPVLSEHSRDKIIY